MTGCRDLPDDEEGEKEEERAKRRYEKQKVS